jgi:serine/threonine-protein kinase
MVGRTIAHYEILAKVGEGGMGVVYKARDTQLNRMVAIKVLPADKAVTADGRLRFAQEAKAASALNHPNIVVVHQIGTEDDLDYIVMEFVDGVTLDQVIPSGGMKLREALHYAIPIADALARAHSADIIHRDLKPGNIIAGKDGQVKLVDFGLAKFSTLHLTGESDATCTTGPETLEGSILGTVAYMSPEQAEGRKVDARSDIFSFGAVLYEMVTGQRAFAGDSNLSILAAVLKGNPKPAGEVRHGLPRDLVKVIDRCLRKDPAWRYQSAADLKVSLSELEKDLDSDRAKQAEPARSRWLVPLWLLAGVGIGLAMAATGWMAGWWGAARPNLTASADHSAIRLDADLGPEAQLGATYASTRATISPDGKRLIYSARGPDGKQMLASRFLDGPTVTLIPGTESASDPFFSPDGQWIGFFADGKLKKVAFGGGEPITLAPASNPRGASWGEDGTIIAALTNTAGLYRISTVGGAAPPQRITELKGAEATHRWPQIVPGAGAVIFTSSTDVSDYESAAVERLDLKTGQRRVVFSGGYFGRYSNSGHLLYVHGRALYAVSMNSAGDVRGTPVLILDDVASSNSSGAGQYDLSRTGIFVYYRGKSKEAAQLIDSGQLFHASLLARRTAARAGD